MKIIKYSFVLALLAFSMQIAAQTTKWREMHKVKKKETIFGIARDYGLTIDQLIKANPEMTKPGYELKKGDFIFIPYADEEQRKAAQAAQAAKTVGTGFIGSHTTVELQQAGYEVVLDDFFDELMK